MQIPYVRRGRETRRPRWTTECGFRVIRCLSMDHNAARLIRHVTQQIKQDRRTESGRRFAMKLRRMRKATA